MPYVRLQDPWGMNYAISTRRVESTLLAWFDEMLPIVNHSLGQHDAPPAVINVSPMWEPYEGGTRNPDWHTDTRVLGRLDPFPAKTGTEGLKELERLRQRLAGVLAIYRKRDHDT